MRINMKIMTFQANMNKAIKTNISFSKVFYARLFVNDKSLRNSDIVIAYGNHYC